MIFECSNCGGLITAEAKGNFAIAILPGPEIIEESIPERARYFLMQAIETKHSPSASIIMSASAVDAMLKAIGFKEGNLYERIKNAVEEGILTKTMAEWANLIRLDANAERHVDDKDFPTVQDGQRSIDFVKALALYLFELPAKIPDIG